MAEQSKIEWTDATWNPVTGCTPISAGCKNCYARRFANRLRGRAGYPADEPFRVTLHPERLGEPFHWRKPRRIFVSSMGDLFHEKVPFEFVDSVFARVASSGTHAFQVLTKRPKRMLEQFQRISAGAPAAAARYARDIRQHFDRYKREFLEGYSLPSPPTAELRFLYDSAARQEGHGTSRQESQGISLEHGFSGGEYHWRSWPLDNLWLGVTAENQTTADERIPLLLQTPAAVRFVSLEPLLGSVQLPARAMNPKGLCGERAQYDWEDGTRIDWVIVGGETGPGARPMDPDWARAIRDDCATAGVPFFMKQMSGKVPIPDDLMVREYPASEESPCKQ